MHHSSKLENGKANLLGRRRRISNIFPVPNSREKKARRNHKRKERRDDISMWKRNFPFSFDSAHTERATFQLWHSRISLELLKEKKKKMVVVWRSEFGVLGKRVPIPRITLVTHFLGKTHMLVFCSFLSKVCGQCKKACLSGSNQHNCFSFEAVSCMAERKGFLARGWKNFFSLQSGLERATVASSWAHIPKRAGERGEGGGATQPNSTGRKKGRHLFRRDWLSHLCLGWRGRETPICKKKEPFEE